MACKIVYPRHSSVFGNAERRPFIIAKNAFNVYTQRRSLFTRRTPGRRVEAALKQACCIEHAQNYSSISAIVVFSEGTLF